MKQAYKRHDKSHSFCPDWHPVELTGICKKVTGGTYATDRHYYQAQRRLFGIPIGKYWIPSYDVEWYDAEVETIYECKCGETE